MKTLALYNEHLLRIIIIVVALTRQVLEDKQVNTEVEQFYKSLIINLKNLHAF